MPRRKVNHGPETHLERVGRQALPPHVRPVGNQARFKPLDIVGRARADAEGRTGLLDPFPKLRTPAPIAQVKLDAALFRPARARHDQRDAVQFGRAELELAQLPHPIPDQRGRDIDRAWSLYGERRHVWFTHGDVQPPLPRDGARPERDVAVGDGEPDAGRRQWQQDGVVDQPTVMVADRHVTSLSGLRSGEVSRRQQLRQHHRVRPVQLNLPLCCHVPHRHAAEQPIILRLGVAEMAGNGHVVVDREGAHAIGHRRLEIGRGADVRPDMDGKTHFARPNSCHAAA